MKASECCTHGVVMGAKVGREQQKSKSLVWFVCAFFQIFFLKVWQLDAE